MKNNYSLAERNRIVEEYLPYVNQVIRRNRALMRAARLEYDDVYQQLSLRLIRAVSTYDPDKGELGAHIWAQLRFELLNCKAPRRLCGMTELPRDFRRENIISFEAIREDSDWYRSEPMVLTTGKIPEADICFLDEAFKCNDGVLNSLLTALNERKYTNEGRTYPIPTISFFAASNEIPNFNDPQEKILVALYDRLELKVVTQNIAGRENRLRMLKAIAELLQDMEQISRQAHEAVGFTYIPLEQLAALQ